MPAVGLLTWTMGSEMLITPRQHQAMILPYLCFLVAAWAFARGDGWAAVVGVVAGSLVAQTHLSYPILVAGLAVAALIVHVLVVRGLVVRDDDPTPDSSRRPYAVAIAVGLVLWSQSLYEQVFRDGNIGIALFSSGEGGQAGFGDGIGLVARVLVSPHTLLRPGFQRFDAGLTPAGPASVVILVIAVVAASAWIITLFLRRDLSRAAGPIVALVAVLAGILDATLLPETGFGYPVGNYRWLWATGAFVVVVVLVDRAPRVEARVDDLVVVAVAGALCTAVAVANLWPSVEYDQEAVYRRQTGEVAAVVEQLAETDLPESLIVDSSDVTFGTPIVYPVLIELQRQGVAFRFDDDTQISRFGSGRVADGSEVGRLTIITGPAASGLGADPLLVASSESVAGQPVAILLESLDPSR
jgi:hypothetical protein